VVVYNVSTYHWLGIVETAIPVVAFPEQMGHVFVWASGREE
jgi:hypothetical protein